MTDTTHPRAKCDPTPPSPATFVRALLGATLLLSSTVCTYDPADDWVLLPGLRTRWTENVDPHHPLPEYPRPQMVREEWVNLNGMWEYAVAPAEASLPDSLPGYILVPYPVESALSGIDTVVSPEERVWYRRSFSLPRRGEGRRWLLHFGAVDWEAEVFLNGVSLGTHQGGYDPFTFEITDLLLAGGEDQELVVAVWDPTDQGEQPRGKQVLDPHGIWYTAVTGIWQTVWLEPVPEVFIGDLRIIPDLEGGRVEIQVEVEGSPSPVPIRSTLTGQGQETVSSQGFSDQILDLEIPDPRPWSPDDPFLYDLQVQIGLNGGDSPDATATRLETDSIRWDGDSVESYVGLRSIAVAPDETGHQRLVLNGEPLFHYGLLDQGWWPDGLYTAPTDEALRSDIIQTRELGFNLIRKHVKVEPARWYYHADREGVLVWQDMPSGDNQGAGARAQFARELDAVVDALENHPSIVMWVPFNEGWGQHDTETYVAHLKDLDPSRLVNNASGWSDRGVGDVLDIHRYPGPAMPDLRDTPGQNRAAADATGGRARAGVLGEFGGLGLPLSGHTWVEEDNWGYRSYDTLEELNQAYMDLLVQLRPLVGEGLAAAVYTQTTDVEVEVNGVMTYDRGVVKLNEGAVQANQQVYGPAPVLRPILETSMEAAQEWRYMTVDPGDGWADPEFDSSGWRQGPGGFGTPGTPGSRVRTPWATPEIWLRKEFDLSSQELAALDDAELFLRIHHDEDAQVYLNGGQVASLEGYTGGYRLVPMGPDVRSRFREGSNTVAVHVQQTEGGQYIDLGIVEWVEQGQE